MASEVGVERIAEVVAVAAIPDVGVTEAFKRGHAEAAVELLIGLLLQSISTPGHADAHSWYGPEEAEESGWKYISEQACTHAKAVHDMPSELHSVYPASAAFPQLPVPDSSLNSADAISPRYVLPSVWKSCACIEYLPPEGPKSFGIVTGTVVLVNSTD